MALVRGRTVTRCSTTPTPREPASSVRHGPWVARGTWHPSKRPLAASSSAQSLRDRVGPLIARGAPGPWPRRPGL